MIKFSKFWINISRNISAFIIGFLALAIIPIYGEPFVGCSNNIYISLDPHCGVWPEVLRSFLFVLSICFVSSSAKWIPLVAILYVFFAAIHGGLESINANIWHVSSVMEGINNLYMAIPDLVGGIVAYSLYLVASYMDKKKPYSRGCA